MKPKCGSDFCKVGVLNKHVKREDTVTTVICNLALTLKLHEEFCP